MKNRRFWFGIIATATALLTVLTTTPQPANAGLMEWLGFGGDGETMPATNEQPPADPNKGPVRVAMHLFMDDGTGTTVNGVDYCDFRREKEKRCFIKLRGLGNLLPKSGSLASHTINFKITKWPGADDMVTVEFRWGGNMGFALNSKKIDMSLSDLRDGIGSLPLVSDPAEAANKEQVPYSTQVAKVFFVTSADDRQ